MELKRIIARDAKSAHDKAVALYGKDALVISNAQVRGETELIIAVEEAPTGPDPAEFWKPIAARPEPPGQGSVDPPRHAADPKVAASAVKAETSTGFEPFRAAMEVVMRRGAGAMRSAAAAAPAESPSLGPVGRAGIDREGRQEPALMGTATGAPRSDPASATSATAATTQVETARSREIVDLIRAEISQLRRELAETRAVRTLGPTRRLPEALQPIARGLAHCCSDYDLRSDMLEAIAQCEDADSAQAALRTWLAARLPEAIEPDWTGVHALLGRSAAGKTLAAAKLLDQAIRARGAETIAWVSLGDNRPGAWSQVQMLSSQLGVDAYRARDVETLRTLLDELADRAFVLIDTPGIDPAGLARSLAQVLPQVRRHLVAAADAAPASLRRLAELPGADWTSMLLARLDEAELPWQPIELLAGIDWPRIAAVSSGHRLSDRLEPFVPGKLLESALKSLDNPMITIEDPEETLHLRQPPLAHDPRHHARSHANR